MPDPSQPSPRKLVGMALILLIIVVWAGLIALFAPFIGKWHALVQAPFYLVMGIAWIFPLKPVLRWMETGRFGAAPAERD